MAAVLLARRSYAPASLGASAPVLMRQYVIYVAPVIFHSVQCYEFCLCAVPQVQHALSSASMKDMSNQLKHLHAQAAECTRLSEDAPDTKERELLAMLADHYRVLAAEVQKAIDSSPGPERLA